MCILECAVRASCVHWPPCRLNCPSAHFKDCVVFLDMLVIHGCNYGALSMNRFRTQNTFSHEIVISTSLKNWSVRKHSHKRYTKRGYRFCVNTQYQTGTAVLIRLRDQRISQYISPLVHDILVCICYLSIILLGFYQVSLILLRNLLGALG